MMKKLSVFKFALILFLSFIYQGFSQDISQVTLNGLVEEYEYDSAGLLISVVFNILDDDFNYKSYIVVNDTTGDNLLELVGENIDVTGIIKQDKGKDYITILSYSLQDDDTEDDDEYIPPDDIDDQQEEK